MAAAEDQAEPESVFTCRDGDDSCAARLPPPPQPVSAGVEACPPGQTGTPCIRSGSEPKDARKDCVEPPSGAENCPSNVDETRGNCASAETSCKNRAQDTAHANSNENSGIIGSERQGHNGESRPVTVQGSHTDAGQEGRANVTVAVDTPGEPETRETQSVNGSQDAASSPAAVTGGSPAADGQTERNVFSSTEEGGAKQGSETAQPSSSSNNSDTGSSGVADATATENNTPSTESESLNKQEGDNATAVPDTNTTTLLQG
ncbi:uncharacterized protein TM35_000581280 [Trypanosoma theileri]|uniref:Uncharacterized protein n=1 Tax=Trypanosoma theileri TaxID=67003 RepID=A0A1X0NGC9_9TRYP|nr:uncharacterized protein TM35_000581280 [Trypanosoma theileri]ORC83765.1 hypothetical protein TM35_000581280 [Trypanosoma theileri]